ncbi:hypothetical protein AMTR_s00008p00165580 [Amborella trichopoda]|uniref:Uncharacterized protein n=1 Tax=Amborella trichopoda TaxID=13333 RepID=W1NIL0_AMBTC|nr:hypothetical protein AMTR_s00008p00165580 [Amborella trichopoda]
MSVFCRKMRTDFYVYLTQLKDDYQLDNNKRPTDEAQLFYQRTLAIEEGKSLIEALPTNELYESDRVMRDLECQNLATILEKLCYEKERVVKVIGEASTSSPIGEAFSSNTNAEVVGEASNVEVVGDANPNGEDLPNPQEILKAVADAFELANEAIEEAKSLIEALPKEELYENKRVMCDLEHQMLAIILEKV